MRRPRAILPLLGLAGLVLLPSFLLLGRAEPPQESRRVIRGQVLDENDKAVPAAIVHLRKLATKEQWSVVTDKEGRYQFNDVDRKADYELFAEWREQRSRTRTVSQFDTRPRVTINLKLEPAKKPNARAEKENKEEKQKGKD